MKPTILITNDDGIAAPGLRMLIGIMRGIGNVVVVAPDKPQSGMGHAVTMQTPLRIHEIAREPGYEEYSCNGTPVDCVKMGQKVILKANPDLIVSGINHGSNASVNVLYSGTMAAVLEGAMEDIPSIGFSLDDYSFSADFSHTAPYITSIAENVLRNSLPAGVCLNVNIPALNGDKIRGIKVVRQAKAFWDESFEERKDPHRRNYYWLQGVFVPKDNGTDTDEWALRNNYVSVVPVQIDLTAHQSLEMIRNWNLNGNNS
ncbi:MAG TPA: 5'/3'-nucleotidase SurE [Bacteroidales bacterium]|nr:5'/3'-nucleotidase SurE [Bacteroidales bacterium]HPT02821.1 5'/3'-nucleotidase SurE [Bacteroidales bacterium]